MSEGKTMVRVLQVGLGGPSHEVFRGLLDSVPRKDEMIVTQGKTYEVTKVTHGLWRSNSADQEVTVSVIEVR